jgi:hypothetical protein
MAAIIGFITQIINAASKWRKDAREDAEREERLRLDRNRKPISPPKYYLSLDERNKNVTDPDDPYSSKSISASLDRDTIPIGYSLEQLSPIGFKTEVDNFIKRKEIRTKENKLAVNEAMIDLRDALVSGFTNLSDKDRSTLLQAGLLDKKKDKELSDQLTVFINRLDKDEADISTIDNIIKIVRLRANITQDALDQQSFTEDINNRQSEAADKRTAAILTVVNRALNFKK